MSGAIEMIDVYGLGYSPSYSLVIFMAGWRIG